MKMYTLLFLLFISLHVTADSSIYRRILDLEGEVYIEKGRYRDEMIFQLHGKTAEDVYIEMDANPIYTDCINGYYKDQGDIFQCGIENAHLETRRYYCIFGFNLSKNTLMRLPGICD